MTETRKVYKPEEKLKIVMDGLSQTYRYLISAGNTGLELQKMQ